MDPVTPVKWSKVGPGRRATKGSFLEKSTKITHPREGENEDGRERHSMPLFEDMSRYILLYLEDHNATAESGPSCLSP